MSFDVNDRQSFFNLFPNAYHIVSSSEAARILGINEHEFLGSMWDSMDYREYLKEGGALVTCEILEVETKNEYACGDCHDIFKSFKWTVSGKTYLSTNLGGNSVFDDDFNKWETHETHD